MMTSGDLIKELFEEYSRRIELGEKHYEIKDFYSFFYINKYFSEEEKVVFSKKEIFNILAHLKKKRTLVLEDKKEVDFNYLQDLTKEVYPYQVLFQFCAPFAIKQFNEDELLNFLNFYDSNHTIKFYQENRKEYREVDVSNHLLRYNYVLDLVIYYAQLNTLSQQVINGLQQFKNSPAVKRWEYQSAKIDNIISGKEALILDESNERSTKELSAKDLAIGKKWKWLQQNIQKFIEEKEKFYSIIEELSRVDFFNIHALSPELEEAISLINPDEFEVFVLDIYYETKSEGKKRSGWFLGDKVIAFQIFVWLMHYLNTPNQYSILTKLVEKCFTKIPRVGPTSRKLGDVILRILDESETIEELGILLNLKARAKYPVFREALDASIKKAINFTKLDSNEVEDFFINDYDLINGEVAFNFGEFSSKIVVEDFSKVNLLWYKQDGNTQKNVPAKVKKELPSELKLWKAKQKDIQKELSGQKKKFEGFWQKKKKWDYSNWEKYILNHELIRFISHQLIWQFESEEEIINAIHYEGSLLKSDGEKLNISENSIVSLWHPTSSTTEEVLAWRNFVLSNEIKQPFKQAYREIYLVTDAEKNTSTYSNRFLNHIVRHHKFVALAKQRTWVYASVFTHENPYIEYSDFKIMAAFDIVNSYDLATTGRIHFRDLKKNEAIRMEDVPTIIFSETMRDADLFVGVCSIGIEEEWNQNQHLNYWRNYSTADLSETAKTRRSVLGNMLSKLKIKNQCELTEKYLKVIGKLRTYKIHLGSGNILMEPNDQYLCIIPDRSKKGQADNVFLPFDDDVVFSIILSKAFLLAADDKIEDTLILNQINT